MKKLFLIAMILLAMLLPAGCMDRAATGDDDDHDDQGVAGDDDDDSAMDDVDEEPWLDYNSVERRRICSDLARLLGRLCNKGYDDSCNLEFDEIGVIGQCYLMYEQDFYDCKDDDDPCCCIELILNGCGFEDQDLDFCGRYMH